MVRMAANNIRPLDFRYDEVVSLTETLRTKGRPTLELELLSLFFKGLWQGRTRYDRACCCIDKYEGTLTKHLSAHSVPLSNIKEALCVFMSDTSLFRGRGAASFRASSTRRLHWSQRGWNPDKEFQIVEEECRKNVKSPKQ